MNCSTPDCPVHHQLPGACSNSCPSSGWCYPTISSFVVSFSSRLQSFPASGSFPMSQFFPIRWPKSWNFSFSISPSNDIQDSFPLGCTGWVQLSYPCMTTGETISLTRRTFVGKVMYLLFNMLSRLVITFIPRSKCLLISWLQSPSAVILELPKIVCHCFHCFPIYLPWSDGTRCHDLSFLNVEF